jgi:hypothetical protein
MRLGKADPPHVERVLSKISGAGVIPWYSEIVAAAATTTTSSSSSSSSSSSAARILNEQHLPPLRLHRKRAQIDAIKTLLHTLLGFHPQGASTTTTVVDFCGGSGHLSLVLAAVFPTCRFVVVDFNARALAIARERAAALGLHNVETDCADVSAYDKPFHVGVALHACGSATDFALAACQRARASFIVSPCCVGKIGKLTGPETAGGGAAAPSSSADADAGTAVAAAASAAAPALPQSCVFADIAGVTRQEYLVLARAADFHSTVAPCPTRRLSKSYVELDRACRMAEAGYQVCLGKLPPEAKSPKDDVIWGWWTEEKGEGVAASGTRPLPLFWSATRPCPDLLRCGLASGRALSSGAHLAVDALAVVLPDATAEQRCALQDVVGRVARERDGAAASASRGTLPGTVFRVVAPSSNKKLLTAAADSTNSSSSSSSSSSIATINLPIPLDKVTKRFLHRLAHATHVQHWSEGTDAPRRGKKRGWQRRLTSSSSSSSAVLLSSPPFWPFVWAETGIFVAGRDVEATVSSAIASSDVTAAARLAWSARRRCLSHRIPILLATEVDALGTAEATLASLRNDLYSGGGSGAKWWISKGCVGGPSAAAAASAESSAATSAAGSQTITIGGKAVPDGQHSGPMQEIMVDVEWPALEEWRARHGLPRRPSRLGIVVGLAPSLMARKEIIL